VRTCREGCHGMSVAGWFVAGCACFARYKVGRSVALRCACCSGCLLWRKHEEAAIAAAAKTWSRAMLTRLRFLQCWFATVRTTNRTSGGPAVLNRRCVVTTGTWRRAGVRRRRSFEFPSSFCLLTSLFGFATSDPPRCHCSVPTWYTDEAETVGFAWYSSLL
jgi:hypothetical protein